MKVEDRLSLNFGRLPLWAVGLLDMGRYLARGTRARFKRYPLADRTGSLSCRPLLIIGAPRSGTTLLRSMLAAGGEIAIPPETQMIPAAVRRFRSLQGLGWPDLSRLLVSLFESHRFFFSWGTNLSPAYQAALNLDERERSLARVIDEVFKTYADQQFPEARLWGDQSPLHTLYLPWLFRTFPQARYLHLLRDGRDAIASMIEKGRPLEYAVKRWTVSVEHVQALQRRLGTDQFLKVRYEDLVSTPTETLGQVCEFAGAEFRDRMLDYWKLPTTLEHTYQAHHRNLAKPVFTSSIGKWQERLSPEQQEYILPRISGLLEAFGYLG